MDDHFCDPSNKSLAYLSWREQPDWHFAIINDGTKSYSKVPAVRKTTPYQPPYPWNNCSIAKYIGYPPKRAGSKADSSIMKAGDVLILMLD